LGKKKTERKGEERETPRNTIFIRIRAGLPGELLEEFLPSGPKKHKPETSIFE